MADVALVTAPERLRAILAGAPSPAQNRIPAGHFRRTNGDAPLQDQPVSLFSERPFDVEWTRRAYLNDLGPANAGSQIDSQVDVVIRVGYLEATGGRVATQNTIARDELAIRLAIEDAQNWDGQNSGIVSVDCREASRTDADSEGRCFLEMLARVVVYDTQPMAVVGWR